VFIRTIELFVNRADVCQVILTVSPDDFDVVKDKYAANLMFMNIRLVRGGAERFESVRLGLEGLAPEAELVAVHDAVRPCLLDSWIDAVFEKAAQSGAAILAAPVAATLKRGHAGAVRETVDRAGLWEAQTPQVFRKETLLRAYREAPVDLTPTDDAQLVERLGIPVALVEADRRNLKITSPGDMALAAAILRDFSNQRKAAGPRGAFEEAQW
jgi:2-C-methyl-D-erythritol 4-phosphate cytidylyltransferase